jgi:vacuolar-type H+-ATPase subunit E/Vma4
MDTIKTSEVLEQQIMEDARAKAQRIRAAADRECAVIRAEWEARRAAEIRRLDASRDARIALLRQELASSLPLNSMRLRLAFLNDGVRGAMGRLFASLSARDRARIIGAQIARAAAAFDGAKITATCAGMIEEEARAILTGSLPGVVVLSVKGLVGEPARDTTTGIVVETADGRTRYRGSLAEIEGFLLEEYREELVTALYGKDANQ